MVDNTDIQERIRQERRRRGEAGDITELLALTTDVFTHSEDVRIRPTGFGNTGLNVTSEEPITRFNTSVERPVTEGVTGEVVAENTTIDTSSMIGDMTVTSAVQPEGGLTADPSNLGEDANAEQLQFWSEANANGVTNLDASIFEGELTEDALLENESFLQASETIYDMRHGAGAWAEKVAEEGWTMAEASEELGKEGLDYISDFNFQLWEAGKTGLTIGSKTQEQQIALLYMMRAVEHKNMSWSGAGRAAMSMLTDPVNIGITAVSVLLAIPTFGGSLAVGGAAVAGRGVVGTAVAKAGQTAFMRSLTSTVQGQVARLATSRVAQTVANNAVTQGTRRLVAGAVNNQATRFIANNAVSRYVGNSAVGRAFNSEIARRAGRYSIVPGMMDSYYTDRMVFNTENHGMQALGYEPMEYSWQRGAFSIGIGGTLGYGMGRTFGAGSQLAGDGFRSVFRRTASEAAPDEAVARAATTGADEPTVRTSTPDDGPTPTRVDGDEAAPTRTTSEEAPTGRTTTGDEAGPRGRVEGQTDGPFTPGQRTTFASASSVGKELGLRARPRDGELLPDPSRTWLHTILGKRNPYIWIANKFPKVNVPAAHLPSDLSFGAYIDPLINAIDDRLVGAHSSTNNVSSLLNGLKGNLGRVQDELRSGAIDAAEATRRSAQVLRDFQSTNAGDLTALDRALKDVVDEMRLERDLAKLTREAKMRTNSNDDAAVQSIRDRAKQLIDDYEASTGRTFRSDTNKTARIEAVAQGAGERFYLKDKQAEAMLNYAESVRSNIRNFNDPAFISRFEAQLTSIGEDPLKIRRAVDQEFAFIFKEANIALKRSVPENRAASQSVLWRRPQDHLPDLNERRIGLRRGFFNPNKRDITRDPIKTPSSDNNLENIIMKIEGMDPNDTKQAPVVASLIKAAYGFDGENEAIEAFARLNDRAGKDDVHALVEATIQDLTSKPDYTSGSDHYRYFIDEGIGSAGSIRHSPERWAERDVYQKYTDWSYKFRHARKFVYAGNIWSTPGRIFFKEDPIANSWNRPLAYILGGNHTSTRDEATNRLVHSWNLWKKAPEDATGMKVFRHHATQAAWRIPKIGWRVASAPFLPGWHATKFLASNQVVKDITMFSLGAGGVLIGAEEGLEALLPSDTWITDENGNIVIAGVHPDLGARALGVTEFMIDDVVTMPLKGTMYGLDWAGETLLSTDLHMSDAASYIDLDDNPFLEGSGAEDFIARTVGDRYDPVEVTADQVREALQDMVFDGNTPFHALPPAQQNAIIQQLDADNDLSEEHINEVYRNVIGGGVTTTTPDGTTTTPDGTTTTPDGTTTTPDGTTTTTTPDSTTPRGPVRRVNTGPQESGWDSAGNVLGTVGNAAFGWLGEGTTSSIGNMLSSTAGWFGGFFNKLASGEVRNGQKWLAGGMGLVAALVGGP
ncbi:MAG: hypothetical protein JKY71_00845, partial [Alphaproteobacteria bacterium]|nr:hypothetical protein [Alphaproteobacteria bacterium]